MTGAVVEYASIASSEQNAWLEALGARITVKPLPDYVTEDVERRLSELGFRSLIYMPDLGLHEPTLRKIGPEAYVTQLARRYPRWRPFENLSFAQKSDYRLSRNLTNWFWSEIKNRRIEFPQLPGQWMAVEDVEKPEADKEYARTPFAEILGLVDGRIGYSFLDICKRIESQKYEVLSYAGISDHPVQVRFLDAIEYNLMANREGWGRTNIYEWTNTKYQEKPEPDPDVFEWWVASETGTYYRTHQIIAGNSLLGGAGRVTTYDPDRGDRLIGFRCAILFVETEEHKTAGKTPAIDDVGKRNCELLGIKIDHFRNLPEKERERVIEASFRSMALRCHPDLGGTNEKMQEIIMAREQLKSLFS